MDYIKFIEQIPSLYNGWGEATVRPKLPHFQEILSQVRGMTSVNVLQLLNSAVACMEPGEVYCEIGSFQGATLIGALVGNTARSGLAVDNFSEFDPHGHNLAALRHNLIQFGMAGQVQFFNHSFEEFFARLCGSQSQIGVFFYDGAHDYRSQLLALLLARPFLAHRSLIVVDDSNSASVRQATWDFLASHPKCRLLLDLPTPANCHPTFWNGLRVLAWDHEGNFGYDWPTLQRARQTSVIESIYWLQNIRIKKEDNRFSIIRAEC